jgi:G3E family GTPase
MQEIKLYLISGFLGAGKTTFLKRLIQEYSDSRIGVIVNEFGQIGIDGTLIAQNGIEMTEINNGSMFCTCKKANFIQALIRFSELPIDVLLIESSGLSDPSEMGSLLEQISDRLTKPYRYSGSVCIVDSTTFLDLVDVLTPIGNQIAASNCIILNKTDIADGDTVELVEAHVRRLNPEASVYKTTHAAVDAGLLPICVPHSGDGRECCNKSWNRPGSFLIEADGYFSSGQLLSFAKAVSGCTLRLKGFARTDEGSVLFEYAGKDTFIHKIETESDTLGLKLVLISRLRDAKSYIEKAWKETLSVPATIKQVN